MMKKPVDDMNYLEVLVEVSKTTFVWWKENWAKPSVCVLVVLCLIGLLLSGRLPYLEDFIYITALIVFTPFLFIFYNLVIGLVYVIPTIPVWIFHKLFGDED